MLTNKSRIVRTARRGGAEAGISLAKRRDWYADDGGNGGNGSDSQNGQSGGDGGNADEIDLSALPEPVQAHIRTMRQQNAALKQEAAQRRLDNNSMAERLKAIEDAQTAQLQEQGNFKAIAERNAKTVAELTPYKDRTETLETMIRQSNESRIESIPEDMRGLVPMDYPPEKLSGWLDANLARLTKAKAPDLDHGAGGGSGKDNKLTVTDADRRAAEIAQAQGHKITAEDVAKRRTARGS